MVDQTMNNIIASLFCLVVVFLLYVLHMVYLAYCRNSCGQKRSCYHLDKTQTIIYVRKEASETSESQREGQTAISVSLLSDQYSV